MSGLDGIVTNLPFRLPESPVRVDGGELGKRLDGGALAPADGATFTDVLANAIGEVAATQNEARQGAEALARGEPVELHDLMIAMGKSEVAFNLMLEVRNKLLDAWEQLSHAAV